MFVCPGFGIAESGTLFAFDTVQKNPLKAVKSFENIIILPMAGKPAERKTKTSGQTTSRKTHMVKIKELVKALSPEDRSELYNSFILKDGRIVSMSFAQLKRTFNTKQMDSIIGDIFYSEDENEKASEATAAIPARLTQISESLKDLPVDIRDEFIGSMMFKNGAFVSAYIGGLRRILAPARMDEILQSVTSTPGLTGSFGPKALCLGTTCYDSACSTSSDGGTDCIDSTDSVCSASCHSD